MSTLYFQSPNRRKTTESGLSGTLVGWWAEGFAAVTDAATGPAAPPPGWVRLPQSLALRVLVMLVALGATLLYFDNLRVTLAFDGITAAAAIALVQTAPLVLFVTLGPLWAWRVLVFGLILELVIATPGRDEPQGVSFLVLAALLYHVARAHPRRTVVGTGLITGITVLLPLLALESIGLGTALTLSGVGALLLYVGDAVRSRTQARASLATATIEQHESLEREAVLRERAHIARELHDVVAHHMSMIAIQAEAAPLRYPDLSPDVVRSFGVIRDASRDGLREMRRVVGALREEDQGPEHAPQPGVSALPALVAEARAAGMTVVMDVLGDATTLPAALDVSVYRLVQEALSNARRHAPRAAVMVQLRYETDRLHVRVVDDGAVAT